MAANVARRRQSRRRLAALAFLSNISLDGTHRDTFLGVLNLNCHYSKKSEELEAASDIVLRTGESDVCPRAPSNDDSNTTSYSSSITTKQSKIAENGADPAPEKKNSWSSSCDEKSEHVYTHCRVKSFSRSKERVQKFVLDTKAKLHTLKQKRKHLMHQRSTSESLKLPSGLSTESLTYGPQSRKSSINFDSLIAKELDGLKQKTGKEKIESERLVFVSSRKVPFAVSSYIPFRRQSSHVLSRCDTKSEVQRRRHNSTVRQLTAINDGPDPLDILALLGIEKPEDGQDISFGHYLTTGYGHRKCKSHGVDADHLSTFGAHYFHASGCMSFDQATSAKTHSNDSCTGSHTLDKTATAEIQEAGTMCRYRCHAGSLQYNPNLLDDPELIAGKHCILLSFPSYVTSVINYVKPEDLKKDLNDKFKEKFPHISLTLSKLRSLKKEMVKIARHECNIDLAIVAQAFVYFEKLILKMLVNKQNRKLCAGTCLLLSAKLNDVKGVELRCLLEKIEAVFRVNRKDLLCLEFRVLVALEFSLHLPLWDVLPHYQRLVYTS